MSPESILAELDRRGIELSASGDRLRFRPIEAIPPDLLEELRKHKPNLLRLLSPPTVALALAGVTEAAPPLRVNEVCAMTLDAFATAALVVEMRSSVLGEVVIFASDNAHVDPGELRPAYRASELRALLALTNPDDLRQVHAFKKTFRGTITDSSPNSVHPRSPALPRPS
jgi:hypothetical protein